MPNTVLQLLDLPQWQDWDNVKRSQARERLFDAHLRDDPARENFYNALPEEEQIELREQFIARVSQDRPDLFSVQMSPESREEYQEKRMANVGGEIMPLPARTRERVTPEVRRPLYDPATEAFISEVQENPDIVDLSAVDSEGLMGVLGLLGEAAPKAAEKLAPQARQRAREILEERYLVLFPEAEQEIDSGKGKAKLFAREFVNGLVSIAGGAGLGSIDEFFSKGDEELVKDFEEQGDTERAELARKAITQRPFSQENRALMLLAGEKRPWQEATGTALTWMGGVNAVFRGGIRALPAVPVRDKETGAKILNAAGQTATRRPHFAIDPLSRKGLAVGAAADATAGAFYGPEYGPNWAAEAFGVEPSRLTTAAEGAGTGLIVGTLMRAGSNSLMANRIRQMPEFADIPQNLGNKEFVRRAAEKWAEAWEAQRRSAVNRPRPRDTESMGGEFVDDVAEGARRPDFQRPTIEGPSTAEAPRGTPAARPTEGPSGPSSAMAPETPGSPQLAPGEKLVKPKGVRVGVGMRADGEEDILNIIEQHLGGISPASKQKYPGGEYDGYHEVMNWGPQRNLRGGGPAVDEAMVHFDSIGMKFETPDELWQAISAAAKDRERTRHAVKEQVYKDKVLFALTDNEGRAAPQKTDRAISPQELNVGDVFRVKGEKFTMKDLDPDTGEIIVEDGVRLTLPEDTMVFVDRGIVEAAPYSGSPNDPFSFTPAEWLAMQVKDGKAISNKQLTELKLDPPQGYRKNKANLWVPPAPVRDAMEDQALAKQPDDLKLSSATPEELQADARKVAEQQAAATQRQQIEEGQARRLTGDSSDVGQGRLFTEDEDLFSGPAAQAGEGQPRRATPQEIESPVKRFRPKELIEFKTPITGPSGSKLVAYEWKWRPEEILDRQGEEKIRRVSDWEKATASSETGRDLVHHFFVRHPSGNEEVVSAESVLTLLGYTGKQKPKEFSVNALKTLAKNQMRLFVKESQVADLVKAYQRISRLPRPSIEEIPKGKDPLPGQRVFKMGETYQVQREPGPLLPNVKRSLDQSWVDDQLRAEGFPGHQSIGRLRSEIAELKNRIKKQETKVGARTTQRPETTEATAVHHSGPAGPRRPSPFKPDRGNSRKWPTWVKDKGETPQGRKMIETMRRDTEGRQYGVRSIAKFLDEAVGVETRKLKSQVSKRHPANYRPFSHTTQTGEMNSQILFHETGHGLFELLEARSPGFWKPWARSLLAMTGEPGSMASAQNTTEGVAEWLRRYITSPADMAGYPDLTQAILGGLDALAPGVAAAFRDASRAYFQHSTRSSTAQFRSFNTDIGAGPPSLSALREWLTGTTGKLIYEGTHKFVARGHPINRLDQAVFKSIVKNREEMDWTIEEAYKKAKKVRDRETYPLRYAYQNILRIQPEANHALRGSRGSKGLRVIDPETGNFKNLTDYSFADIVKAVGPEHWEAFQAGGFALTAFDRFLKRGLAYPGQLDGIGARDLRDMITEAEKTVPNFMRHYRKVEDYFNKLQELKDFGGLKKAGEVAKMQAAYDFYWPLPRIGTRGGGGKGHERVASGDYRAFGSREGIRDLMEVAEERTLSTLTGVYWNQLGTRIVDSMENIANDPNLPFFVKREAGRVMLRLKMPVKSVAKLSQEEGKKIVAEALRQTLDEVIDPDIINLGWEFKDVFRKVDPNEFNVIRLLRNGEPEFYQIGDPVLFHLFSTTERPNTIANILGKLIGPTTANWKREKTQNVPFAVYSLVRDSFTGVLFGEEAASLIPGANFVRGVFERFQKKYPQITQEGELLSRQLQTQHNFKARMKNSAAWNWMMEGMVDYRHPNALVRAAANIFNPHNILNAAIYKPADFINTITGGRYISPFQEESAREGAAAFAKDRGLSDEAANYRYWRSAGNFAEQPGLGDFRVIARLPGFWNPMAQGIYQTVDRLVDPEPAKMFNLLGRLAVVSALSSAIGLGLYNLMSEKERKRQRERSIQDRMSNADWFGLRVPFPYGLEGVAASLAYNSTMDYMLDQDTTPEERRQMRHLLSTRLFDVGTGVGMTMGPLGQALMEAKANYSFFWDRHIVSPWMQNLPESEQRTMRTPEFYSKLGEWLDYSPAKIEYIVRSGLSMQIDETIKAVDKIKNDEIRNMTDIPYVGRMFIREPEGFNARSVRRLETLDNQIQYLDRKLNQKGYGNLHDTTTWHPIELSPDMAALQMQVNQARVLRFGLQHIKQLSELANSSYEWSRETTGADRDRWIQQYEDLRAQIVIAAQSTLSANPQAAGLLEDLVKQAEELPKPPPEQRKINLIKNQ